MKKKFINSEYFFVILLFLSYLFIWILGSGGVHAGDSDGYKNPIIEHDFNQISRSLIGDWYRTPAVVVPFELVGNYFAISLLQFVTAFIANAVLAITLIKYFQNKKFGYLSAIICSLLLLSNNIVSWNWEILSEGLGISYTVLAISMFIRATKTPKVLNLLLFLLFAFLAGMTRLPMLALFFLMAICLLVLHIRKIRSWRIGLSISLFSILLTGAFIAVFTWWSASFIFWNQGTPREMYTAVHTTSELSPIGSKVMEAALKEIPPPSCFRFSKDSTDVNPAISENSLCPEAKLWAEEYSSWYPKYLLKHPKQLWEITVWATPRSVGNGLLSGGVSLIPLPVSEVLLGTNIATWQGGDRPVGNTDPRVYFDVYLFLAMISALVFFARPKEIYISTRVRIFILLALASLSIAVVGTITLPTTNLEIGRIGVEPNIAFRILLSIAFWEIFERTYQSFKGKLLPE